MIPKIIHYIWLGRGEKPELVQRCIASWHRFMPDWQYMEWNENTIDAYCAEHNLPSPISNLPYCREAYDARKFAFVSDYVRLWALDQFGGVYLDTDVEVICAFDMLLDNKAFIGFEESLAHLPGTCVIGCEPHCLWVQDMLSTYDDARFVREDGLFDLTTNVQRLGQVMVECGLIPNGEEQFIGEWGLQVYDHHYFSPITSTRVMRKNKDTYAIHHFAESWHDKKNNQSSLIWRIYNSTITREIINAFIQLKRSIKKYV